jgi:hypothetical protein
MGGTVDIDENGSRILTQIAAILQIAHRDPITQRREELLKDDANKAIFKAASSWATTADIENVVVKGGAASRSTLYVRLADLADRGLLERRKAGNTTEYRNSGLV